MPINGLVPARFLTLTAHLILTIVLYWSMNANINACLPVPYYANQYASQYSYISTQLIIGVSVAIGLMAFEMIGFFAGISMFMPSQGLISMAAHSAGAISLSFYVFQMQPCYNYWYIFGFTNVLPAICEIFTFIAVLGCRKGPY